MNPKTERFEMRLDQEILSKVDAWRSSQEDVPSRAEAIRRLIELALRKNSGPTSLYISKSEKLIIGMLCDILKAQKVNGELDPDFIMGALYGGHEWALEWDLEGLLHDHKDKNENLTQVVDILDMWFCIETAYKKMSQDEKDHIKNNVEYFGDHVKFPGFDGNNEAEHIGIARFLIDKMDRFTYFKKRDLNSHAPSIEGYERMTEVFFPIRTKLVGRELSASEIAQILQARVHPSTRKKQKDNNPQANLSA